MKPTARNLQMNSQLGIPSIGISNHDLVVFNRQPSLHMHSMMAHTIRILPGETFRLNPQCTHPYNADFDGDETNCHVMQRIDACAEMSELMHVSANLISAQIEFGFCTHSGRCHWSVQASDPNTILSRDEAMHHVAQLRHYDISDASNLLGAERVPGVLLLSALFPLELCFKTSDVCIVSGRLIKTAA